MEVRKVIDGEDEEGGDGGMGATNPHEVGTVVKAKRRRRGGRRGWNAHFPAAEGGSPARRLILGLVVVVLVVTVACCFCLESRPDLCRLALFASLLFFLLPARRRASGWMERQLRRVL